jgi:hypothetical protein
VQARGGGALSFVFTVLSFVAHVGSGIYAIYVNVCVCVGAPILAQFLILPP